MRIGTLFSGGLATPEQALKQMGKSHEVVFACEFDKFARENYKANHDTPDEHFHTDINDMCAKQYKGKVDVIVGGSPCQDFSIAGLRAGIEGKRGQLIWQYHRVIMEAQPDIFIYENVKGMVSDKGGKTIKDFEAVFRESGYYCHKAVLNTKNYGVPQNRERVYIVGFKDHELYHRFTFADKIKLEKRLKDVLEDDVDEKYYLSDERLETISKSGRSVEHGSEESEIIPCLIAGYSKVPTDGFYLKVKSATARGYETATTGDSINLTHPDSNTRRGRVGAGVAQTLDCACNQAVIEDRIRKLTPRECFRLQGCDDTFKIAVSKSQAYKIAGNAMSVNILEMIFNQIEKAKTKEPTNTLMDFV